MRFVLDNNLPPKLATVLQAMGLDAIHIRELYGRGDVPDVEWMVDVAQKSWVALTFDRKILVKPNERAALLATGLSIVFVSSTVQTLTMNKQVAFFIGHWENAVEAAQSSRPHKCWFLWQPNGRVKPYGK